MSKICILERQDGAKEHGYIGFSWTTLFFGWLVPLIRYDWRNMVLMMFMDFNIVLISGTFIWLSIMTPNNLLSIVPIIVMLINRIIFASIYNKMQTKRFVNIGYKFKQY